MEMASIEGGRGATPWDHRLAAVSAREGDGAAPLPAGRSAEALALPRRPRRRSRLGRREAVAAYLFITPAMIGLVGLIAFPILFALYISFTDYNFIHMHFIGFANYRKLLHDPLFWRSLGVTWYYVLVSIPLNLVVGLALAMLLNRKLRGIGLFRTIYYLPSLVGGVAVSLLFLWLLNPNFGLINYLLSLVHIHGPQWLYSEVWVIPAMILMSLWGVGGSMLINLAALQGVPTELEEAARIDGASRARVVWHITLPMISPVILFNLILGIIGSFQIFTQAYVMTGGGPDNASLFYVLYLYQNAFEFFKMGYASAMAWLLLVMLLVLTLLVFRSSGAWVFYQSEIRGGGGDG